MFRLWIISKHSAKTKIYSTFQEAYVLLFVVFCCGLVLIDLPISFSVTYQYRNSHCGDKTFLRPSYIHNRISYDGETTSFYWIIAHVDKISHWQVLQALCIFRGVYYMHQGNVASCSLWKEISSYWWNVCHCYTGSFQTTSYLYGDKKI